MNELLKEYFRYSRSERNGLVILTVICIVLVILPVILRQFNHTEEKTDFSYFQQEIDGFLQNMQEDSLAEEVQLFLFDPNTASIDDFLRLGLSKKQAFTIANYRKKGGKFYKKEDFKKIWGITHEDYERLENYISLEDERQQDFERDHEPFEEELAADFELFEFDPNTATSEELQRLGLPKKVVLTILNFRNKGGGFYKREDLAKIYGLSETDFERLFPYIKIEEKQAAPLLASYEPAQIPVEYEATAPIKININTASAEEWQQLQGIGPYFSKQICNFRDKLGGFVSIDQVGETRGFPDSTFQKVKAFLVLDQPAKTINLNTASAKELSAHPYLNWSQANAIVKYRGQHGNFAYLDQLENIVILDKETLEKIRPYLEVE